MSPDPTEACADDAIAAALDVAEAAVAARYGIRPREWASRFRYDVASSADHPALVVPPGSLAQIVRIEPAAGDAPARYRIVLHHAAILERARALGLLPVLVYTLAHELVHLVRFGSGLASFDLPEAERAEEERRVVRLTLDALRPALGDEAAEALGALGGATVP